MKVDKEVARSVADLARLRIEESGMDNVIDNLSRILDLVEEMQAVDTSGVEPLAHPLEVVQRLRADEVTEQNERDRYQAVAPKTEDGLYLVPRVVE